MKWNRSFALITLIAIAFPLASRAGTQHGNDGTFCTSKGYLAYDNFELSDKTGSVTSHLLKIFRFEPSRGIYFAGQVNLPKEVSVNWMICGDDRVAVGGRVIREPLPKKCIVVIAGRQTVSGIADCSDDATESLTPSGVLQGLSIFGPSAAPIPLESTDPDYRYQLLRHLSHKAVVGGVEWRSTCEIVRLEKNGTILQRLVIYDSRRMEYAD
jgi:hypothetical protein